MNLPADFALGIIWVDTGYSSAMINLL